MLTRRSALETSSIAYSMSIGQAPGVISSAGSIIGGNSNAIAAPASPNVATPTTSVTTAQQNQNTDASISQVPANDDKKNQIIGTVAVLVIGALVLWSVK